MERSKNVLRRAGIVAALVLGGLSIAACHPPYSDRELPTFPIEGVPVSTETAAPSDSASRPEAALRASQVAVNAHMGQFDPERSS